MRNWKWYWKFEGDEAYGDECESREAVLEVALKETRADDRIEIIEAVMSGAKVYEGSDFVPFLRSRNHQVLSASASGHFSEASQ